MEIRELSVDMIDEPTREIRSVMAQEGFELLVESIKRLGVLEPIKVKEVDERYEIIYGNRRFLAARQAGLATVPTIVADGESDADIEEMVHENLMREDVNPLDLARWLAQIKQVEGLTNEELSARFGFSHSWAGQYTVLLKCDDNIQAAVSAGQIDVVSARRLQTVKNSNTRQVLLAHAVRGGASQAMIGNWVAQQKALESGNYSGEDPRGSAPDAEPPAPLGFTCRWCREDMPPEERITLPLCSQCYQNFERAVKLEIKHERMEDKNGRVAARAEEELEKQAEGKRSGGGGSSDD